MDFKTLYNADLSRYTGKESGYIRRFHYYFRKTQTSKGFSYKVYKALLKHHREKHGIEISDEVKVGKGFYIGHPYNITINNNAVLGENVNVHRGVLIGRENRGGRKGAPTIGNRVWIGINAAVVGKITIGDDVMIAPNSYVNRDVPDHSIVFGNPCTIIAKDNATESYINNCV